MPVRHHRSVQTDNWKFGKIYGHTKIYMKKKVALFFEFFFICFYIYSKINFNPNH